MIWESLIAILLCAGVAGIAYAVISYSCLASALSRELRAKDRLISAKDGLISALHGEVEALNRELEAKDHLCEALERRIS